MRSEDRRDLATAATGATGVGLGGLGRHTAVSRLKATTGKEPKVHALGILRNGTRRQKQLFAASSALGLAAAPALAVGTTRFATGRDDVGKADEKRGFWAEGLRGSASALKGRGESALQPVPKEIRATQLGVAAGAGLAGSAAARGVLRGRSKVARPVVAPISGVLAATASVPGTNKLIQRRNPEYQVTAYGVRRAKAAAVKPSSKASVARPTPRSFREDLAKQDRHVWSQTADDRKGRTIHFINGERAPKGTLWPSTISLTQGKDYARKGRLMTLSATDTRQARPTTRYGGAAFHGKLPIRNSSIKQAVEEMREASRYASDVPESLLQDPTKTFKQARFRYLAPRVGAGVAAVGAGGYALSRRRKQSVSKSFINGKWKPASQLRNYEREVLRQQVSPRKDTEDAFTYAMRRRRLASPRSAADATGRKITEGLKSPRDGKIRAKLVPSIGEDKLQNGAASRTLAAAIPDGSRGGHMFVRADANNADVIAHEGAHLSPKRNPIRFRERMTKPGSAGAEEGRADAIAGRPRGGYPNPHDTSTRAGRAWQGGYDSVHAAVQRGRVGRGGVSKIAMRTVYHATDAKSAKRIFRGGFEARNEGMRGGMGYPDQRGGGVYTGTRRIAQSYARQYAPKFGQQKVLRLSVVGPGDSGRAFKQGRNMHDLRTGVKYDPSQVIDVGKADSYLGSRTPYNTQRLAVTAAGGTPIVGPLTSAALAGKYAPPGQERKHAVRQWSMGSLSGVGAGIGGAYAGAALGDRSERVASGAKWATDKVEGFQNGVKGAARQAVGLPRESTPAAPGTWRHSAGKPLRAAKTRVAGSKVARPLLRSKGSIAGATAGFLGTKALVSTIGGQTATTLNQRDQTKYNLQHGIRKAAGTPNSKQERKGLADKKRISAGLSAVGGATGLAGLAMVRRNKDLATTLGLVGGGFGGANALLNVPIQRKEAAAIDPVRKAANLAKRDSLEIRHAGEHPKLLRRYGDKGPLPKDLDRETKMKAYEARYVAHGGDKADKYGRRAEVAEGVRNAGLAGATVGGAAWLAARTKRGQKVAGRASDRARRLADTVAVGSGVVGGGAELYGEYARGRRSSYTNSPAGVAGSALRRMRDYTP